MNSVLYLGVEGVLFTWRVSFASPRHKSERPPHPGILLPSIITAVLEHPDIEIVLNSWWVADYGYRRIVQLLPSEIARRTIGATMPGNRTHRRPAEPRTRADILRLDIARRNPQHMTIVDAFQSAIPFEYMSRAVAVSGKPRSNANGFRSELCRLLTSD
ncbi:HAD domain-containing protein [Paraburkholderia caffeinilytica]|uniref:HAD domain-containing protein n=1 Tax=Paraburkholderia caffeinilytica TaxID=1761016 RepID=UPI003DA0596C